MPTALLNNYVHRPEAAGQGCILAPPRWTPVFQSHWLSRPDKALLCRICIDFPASTEKYIETTGAGAHVCERARMRCICVSGCYFLCPFKGEHLRY